MEYPLIEKELNTADDALMVAEVALTWQEDNCWEYIEFLKAKVHDLEQRLQRSKDNIKVIQQIMKDWMEHTLFSRKDNRKEALLNLEEKEDRLSKKIASFKEDGYKIHSLIKVMTGMSGCDNEKTVWFLCKTHLHARHFHSLQDVIQL